MASEPRPQAASGKPPSRPSRAVRALKIVLALTLGLLLLLAAGATWLLGSESGARWALLTAATLTKGGLQVEGVHGRLLGPLRIERLGYVGVNDSVTLRELQLDWEPAALWHGLVHVRSLRAGHLDVVSKIRQTKEAPRLPDSIALPLRLQVDQVQLAGGQIGWGPVNLVKLAAFAFNLDFDGARYRLGLDRFAAQSRLDSGAFSGKVSGQATLSAVKPYPLQATLTSGGEALIEARSIGADGKLTLGGSLAELAATLDLAIDQTRVKGDAVLRPFSPQVLGKAQLRAQALDLSAIKAGLPKTALDIELNALDNGSGELQVRNPGAGLASEARIPVHALDVRFRQQDEQFIFERIEAGLGSARQPAGNVAGSGRYASGALTLTLQTAALDLRRLDGRIRATHLAGQVDLRHADGKQEVSVALSEAVDKNKLTLAAHAQIADNSIAIDRAELRLGGSVLNASGQVELTGKQGFAAQGTLRRFRPQDLGQFAQLPALELNGDFSVKGARAPQLEADIAFQIKDSILAGHALAGEGQAQLRADSLIVPKLALNAGANQLTMQGTLAQGDAQLGFALNAPALGQLGPGFGGSATLAGTIKGSLQQPRIVAEWKATQVRAPGTVAIASSQGKADVALDRSRPFFLSTATLDAVARGVNVKGQKVDGLTAQIQFSPQPEAPLNVSVTAEGIDSGQMRADSFILSVKGSGAQHAISATLTEPKQNWKLGASGSLSDLALAPRWQGTIHGFDASGRFGARLTAPATLLVTQHSVQLDQFRLDASNAAIVVEQFKRDASGIATRGRFSHLQVSELLRYLDPVPPISADLKLGGEWNLQIAEAVNGSLSVQRESGDIVMRGNAPVTLGLRTLSASVTASKGTLALQLLADGRQLGHIEVNGATSFGTTSHFAIASDAPLSGSARLDIPTLGWIAPLLSPTLLLEGRLQSDVSLSGTFGKPRFAGQLAGDGLRVFLTDQGVDLKQGVLRADLQGDQLQLQSLAFTSGGKLTVSGPVSLSGDQFALQLALKAERFTVFDRSDRKLVVSGASEIGWREGRAKAAGNFEVNSGFFDIGRADAPQLSDDVVIIGRAKKAPATTAIALDIGITLGDDVVVRGRGLDARLAGQIRLQNGGAEPLRAQGTLRVAKGSFSAYGRELAIEQGLLRFSGPLNNPALDIRAMRRGQEVEAGVAVRGTVLSPRITLVSEPSVTEAEKLSWLVLGRGLSATGEGDMGALQAAASALLTEGAAAGVQSQLASAFGLDSFSIGSASSANAGNGSSTTANGSSLQQRIVTLGKQVSSRLYVSFQQGLDGATSVLLLRYTLSPRLSVEAEAGTRGAVSLFYNFAFD